MSDVRLLNHFIVDQPLGLEDAALASGGGELSQLEIGRGGFQAALEVIEADRGEEVVGGRRVCHIGVGDIAIPAKGE